MALIILLSYFLFLGSVLVFSTVLKTSNACYDGHLWVAHGLFGGLLIMLAGVELILLKKIKRILPLA